MAGLGPGNNPVIILLKGRVTVPEVERLDTEPAGFKRVIAVRKIRIGHGDGTVQGLNHLVFHLIGEIAVGNRLGIAAPTVVDLLVFGQGIGNQRELADIFAQHPAQGQAGLTAHSPVFIGELMESFRLGQELNTGPGFKGKAQIGHGLVEKTHPGGPPGDHFLMEDFFHLVGQLMISENPQIAHPGRVMGGRGGGHFFRQDRLIHPVDLKGKEDKPGRYIGAAFLHPLIELGQLRVALVPGIDQKGIAHDPPENFFQNLVFGNCRAQTVTVQIVHFSGKTRLKILGAALCPIKIGFQFRRRAVGIKVAEIPFGKAGKVRSVFSKAGQARRGENTGLVSGHISIFAFFQSGGVAGPETSVYDKDMRYETWPNLATMFFDRAAEYGDKPFLWAKKDGAYQPLSWRQTAARIRGLAAGLKACGMESGDRIVLVSESRPEWLIADIAIMAAGGISVPAYTTNTVEDHLHILKNSGAKGIIVSTPQLASRLIPAAEKAPESRFIISMSPLETSGKSSLAFHDWAEILEKGKEKAGEVEAWAAQLQRSDTACLIYTSGTGGAPKGVMLSHGAIISNCKGACHVLEGLGLEDEVFLSFLPLSHSYEHTAGQFFPLSIGAQIYYAEGIEHLGGNMLEARPTIMTAVPRLYESLYQRITRAVARDGGLKARLFGAALGLGSLAYEDPKALSYRQRLSNRILDLLVRRKVKSRFGGRLKALVSGGAPLNYEIGLFFTALGLRILQGYGQTESAPVISCNPPHDNRISTVGPPMCDVEVKIAEDGEILARGELLMQGYWNDTKATKAALQEGWLHTGDIGEIDDSGYIRITDRKKDIIVNSGGDNLSPQRVEGILAMAPEIAQAMVYGDRKPHLVAVIVPEEGLGDGEASRAALDAALDRVNAKLSLIERVRRFIVSDAPFTIDNGLLTPTMKIRRHKIMALYKDRLEALYGKG